MIRKSAITAGLMFILAWFGGLISCKTAQTPEEAQQVRPSWPGHDRAAAPAESRSQCLFR